MKLSDFATKLTASNNFIKASFGGFAGSGKTRTASEFIIGAYKLLGLKEPILIIDNEKGSRFLIPLFEEAGIKTLVKDTVNLADVLEAFNFLQNGEIGFLFIDSLTKVYYQFVKDYRKKNNRPNMAMQDWGKVIPSWQEQFADVFVNLDGSCVFTGRGGYEYAYVENPDTHKKEFVRDGVKMKLAGETPFEPDLNVWMELNQKIENDELKIWREGQIMKDRSALIDGKTFRNPKFEDFKPVVEYLLGVEKGTVLKASNDVNLAPTEEWNNKRELREIEIEKIKAVFDKHGFGTSKEDKQLKVLISEKIFGTSSGTEIEKMHLETLEARRIDLEAFFEFWIDADDKKSYIEGYKTEEKF